MVALLTDQLGLIMNVHTHSHVPTTVLSRGRLQKLGLRGPNLRALAWSARCFRHMCRHLPDRLKEAAATVDELLATEFLRVTAFGNADTAVDDALARLVTAARTIGSDGGIDVASILQESSEVRTVILSGLPQH